MRKQVRTLSVYRKAIERLPEFRLVSPPLTEKLLSALGFDDAPAEGDSIIPIASGAATLFNAYGREVVRRDLPKETLSKMVSTSWQDWHGQTHYGIQNREYDAYPRDLIPPPGEFLTVERRGESLVAASRVIRRDEAESVIVNLLNVFLEVFPAFEIVRPDLTEPVRVRRLSWKILPPGRYPFERARRELDDYLQRLPAGERAAVTERIRSITQHNPDFLAVGVGGFSDYVVFGFTAKGRYVLESPNTGNATYVFRDDWEPISRLSKREILQGNLQEDRLVHNSSWRYRIGTVIDRP